MKHIRNIFLWTLLLASAGAHAQAESAITGGNSRILAVIEDDTTTNVYVVQLRTPPTAEYHADLGRTRVSSKPGLGEPRPDRLQKNDAAIQNYAAKLDAEQQKVLQKVAPGTQRIYSYKYSLNGFAARMSPAQAGKLKRSSDVLNVWEDEVRPLSTYHTPTFLELFDRDNGLRSEHELDGDGIVIAFIDSGVAPEHPALQETRPADRPRACRSSWGETTILGKWLCKRFDRLPDVVEFEPPENWNGECESGEDFETTACNNKLIGARWFIDGAENSGFIDPNEFRSARDADGHGTHTATTAAGNRSNASIFGTSIGNIEGMAPKARVAVYKACWLRPQQTRASCNTSDLVNAIDAAVADGVDIINYSVGSSMRDTTAPDDIALMDAAKAGVLSIVAAGNEGPNLATIGSPAGAAWVMTAAASTRAGNSSVESFEVVAPSSIAARYATKEALFSPPLKERGPLEARLILAEDDDTSLPEGGTGNTSDGCQPLTNGDEISGNVALLQRSGCPFTDMVRNAEEAGAIAALVYNIAGDPIVMFGESGLVDIPALMIGQADANLIIAEFDAGNDVDVILEKSLLLTTNDDGNVMAGFSARGPGPIGDILKPDVTAPGVNIIAGYTPDPANATPGENYAYLSGTSMATPHVAGVAALLRQAHPGWSPAAIKSALMTSARQDLQVANTITPANPFDYGAGHIDPNEALNPGLVYDVSNDEYDALACGLESPGVVQSRCDELSAAGYSFLARDINQPSIAFSQLANELSVTRRVTNVSDETGSYSAAVSAPPGISVLVEPASISVGPGETAEFTVTMTYVDGPLDLWRFGSLTWTSADHDVRSSIAVKPTSVSAPGEVSSVGGTGMLTIPVEFGYNGSYSPRVHGLKLPFIRDAANNEPPGYVGNDPDKTFIPSPSSNVTLHKRRIEFPNRLFLRFALFDELTDGNDDLDMYVYYCGTDEVTCFPIGESGSPTSAEEFNLLNPPVGIYYVFVHGFETDEVTGGPGANYDLLSWAFGDPDDAGNMNVSGPAFVSAGTTADVTVNWSNLLPNSIYLGGISHNTPQGRSALTIITIRN
ncbi:MAG: S8 family serine peptidase [Gammaproteobacteria bacterium]|nr:S8 family serine peptidase [Gammaproteobacteria bacterium]